MNKMKADEFIHTQNEYSVRQEAKEFPLMCVISLVYVCNARCPACPYTYTDIRNTFSDAPYMSEETFKIIAEQCGEYGSYIRVSGGGEPLMHPQAIELMEYAKKVNAKIGLITNGSLFNEENTSRLLKANIDMIEFSVDAGNEDTYNIVRAGLDWNKLIENVERTMRMRNEMKSSTRIICSIVNQKFIDLEKAELFWKNKVDHVQLRKFLTWGMGDPDHSADPIPYLKNEEKAPCPWLFERLNIDSRGNITLCGYDIPFKYNLGSVYKNTIKDIWLGKEFEDLRQKHLKGKMDEIEICSKCTDYQYRTWTYNYYELVKNAEKNKK